MSYQWSLQALFEKPVRHRIFVSYQHSRDQAYYDAFSRIFHDTFEAVYDNSLERRVDSDNADYVIRRIRNDYISGTSCTVVLIGSDTWKRKYVDWEIKATLEMGHGLIGAYLPSASRDAIGRTLVPGRLHDNVHSGYSLWLSWEQLTASADSLNRYVADAKARSALFIVNNRERLLRNLS